MWRNNINLANSSRFKIIKKWEIRQQATAGVSGAYSNTSRTINFYKKCNIPVEFSSTTGALTELKSNNLFLVAGSGGAEDDAATFAGSCRLRFTD